MGSDDLYNGFTKKELIEKLISNEASIPFTLYQSMALDTAQYPDIFDNLEYPTLGLCGEAGELANKVKKIQRDHSGVCTPEMKDALIKELGDVLWYCAAIANELRVNLGYIAAKNLLILSDRAERDVIKGSGDDR